MQILHIVFVFSICAILAVVMATTIDVKMPQQVREFLVTINLVKLPTEEDVQRLEKCYEEVATYLENNTLAKDEIISLQSNINSSIVCSEVNRNFNYLAEKYEEYQQRLISIQNEISRFEKEYKRYVKLLSAVPKYAPELLDEKQAEYEEVILPMYEEISTIREVYMNDQEEVERILAECRQIADEIFILYYDIFCHIVNAEAGNCPAIEQCYVANVIENRIRSPRFPNTPYDVVFAEGQYSPTWNGSYYNEPSDFVKQNMEDYLRGRVETGMPENVFYQALFPQGRNWKHMPSGHYFDYG